MTRSSTRSARRVPLCLESLEQRSVPAIVAGDQDFLFGGGSGLVVTETTNVTIADTTVTSGGMVSVGTVVSAGKGNFYIERRHADGSYDTSVGLSGRSSVDFGGDDVATSMAVQLDGKILVAGYSTGSDGITRFALARLNKNLTLDTSFSRDGKVTTTFRTDSVNDKANAIAVHSNGGIVLVGSSQKGIQNDFAIARFTSTGNLDLSFSGDGKQLLAVTSRDDYANAVLLQGSKIIVGGTYHNGTRRYDFCLTRLTSAGDVDTTFGTNGYTKTSFGELNDMIHSLAFAPGGKIVAAGVAEFFSQPGQEFAVVRYTSEGILDPSFSDDGTDVYDRWGDQSARDVAVQLDGKIVVAGDDFFDDLMGHRPLLVRWSEDGRKIEFANNRTFGPGEVHPRSVALQPQGKILVSGTYGTGTAIQGYVARYFGVTPPDAKDDSIAVTEDTPKSFLPTFNDTGVSITITAITAPSHGTVKNASGVVTYTPAANYTGSDSFTYTIRDSVGQTATATVSVTVAAVNDAPINVMPPKRTMNRNGTTRYIGTTAFKITDVDSKKSTSYSAKLSASNGILQVTAAPLATVTGNGTSAVTIKGSLSSINATFANGVTYKPAVGFVGNATLTLLTNDGGNFGSGGAKTDSDSVNVAVINRAPTKSSQFAAFATFRTRKNTTLNVAAANGIRKGFVDADGDTLSVNGVTSPSKGTLTLRNDGSFRYIPGLGFLGTVKFSVRISDGIANLVAEITIIVEGG